MTSLFRFGEWAILGQNDAVGRHVLVPELEPLFTLPRPAIWLSVPVSSIEWVGTTLKFVARSPVRVEVRLDFCSVCRLSRRTLLFLSPSEPTAWGRKGPMFCFRPNGQFSKHKQCL